MRLGVAHHLGWAVIVSATADHEVADRRRIELVEPGLPAAPVHHEGGAHAFHGAHEPLGDDALASLVQEVRRSAVLTASRELDDLERALPDAPVSLSLRSWPTDFPEDIAVQRRVPYESQADSVMYRQVLADLARERGWAVHLYSDKSVEEEARGILGERARQVLHGPRERLGPPWSKDHRIALAATVVCG